MTTRVHIENFGPDDILVVFQDHSRENSEVKLVPATVVKPGTVLTNMYVYDDHSILIRELR